MPVRRLAAPALLAGLFLLTALNLFPRVFGMPGIFDEGFLASGAMMILRGWLPIRDFYVIYGPGQYYLTAALFALFGEDLAVHRLLHLGVLCAFGSLLTLLAWRFSRGQLAWLVLTGGAYALGAALALPNAGYAAVPASLLLVLAACAQARHAETGRAFHMLLAAVCIGLAGLMRWDFGIFGALVGVLGLWCVGGDGLRHRVAWLLVPAALIAALLFLPFVALGGAQRWFAEVPLFLLREFAIWRGLDFVGPQWGLLRAAWGGGQLAALPGPVLTLACAALPFVLAPLAIVKALRRLHAGSSTRQPDCLALLLGLLSLMLLNQMRVRPSLIQGFPAIMCSLPLLSYLCSPALPMGRRRWLVVPMLAGLLLLGACYTAKVKLRAYASAPASELSRAGGARALDKAQQRDWHNYQELLAHLRATTVPGEPIYSGVTETSRLFVNDAMLYFLADRPSAVRMIEMEPGLASSDLGQRELVASLVSLNVRTLVLLNLPSSEANASACSNGVQLLDDHIGLHYQRGRVFGPYAVWTLRGLSEK